MNRPSPELGDLGGYVSACRDKVISHIRAYLEKRTAVLPRRMKACVVDYPYRRGKALRPALMMLFHEACGGRRPEAIRVAATYQLLEDWGIGRDDLLDGGVLRRGKPALHLVCGLPKAVNALDMLHDCVGDMLYSYCGLSSGTYRAVRGIFSEATEVTLGGQHLDLEARDLPLERFTERAYLRIAERKTAFYTVTVPCLLGAELAGRRALGPAIRRFGRALGAAFQIIDDVLDVENDGSGRFGKAPGNDIAEGKRTLVALTALRRLSGEKRRRLAALYGLAQAEKTPAAIAAARRDILASGAAAECRAKAAGLTAAALRTFNASIRPALKDPWGALISDMAVRLRDRAF
jgi:geranylgeranyl diphosphate synthase type II